jgi:hypothetical protein
MGPQKPACRCASQGNTPLNFIEPERYRTLGLPNPLEWDLDQGRDRECRAEQAHRRRCKGPTRREKRLHLGLESCPVAREGAVEA